MREPTAAIITYATLIVVVLALCLLALNAANAHQVMGRAVGFNLYGHQIGSPAGSKAINCCKFSGAGTDCYEMAAELVKNVSGGYDFAGEFVPAAEVTISPTDDDGEARYWICRKPGKPAHCAFVPPRGT